ncbi:hypothetical protein HK099_005934 [Clydaea vesicula]|uniref:Uncharacterized protein n=1 Tax=Clydaea vesicula TaxID=447962 RepID=A0AAD5U311_9FUNG|nr:hypothetical protein HK099_005934 [Clydaea vesicula]
MQNEKTKEELENDARARFLIDSEIIDNIMKENKRRRRNIRYSMGALITLAFVYLFTKTYLWAPAFERDIIKYPEEKSHLRQNAEGKYESAKNYADDLLNGAKDTAKDYAFQAKDSAQGYGNNMADTAKDYAYDAKEKAQGYGNNMADTAKDYAYDAKEKAQGYGNYMADNAKDYAYDAKDKAQGYGKNMKDTAKDYAYDAKERAKGYAYDAKEQAKYYANGAKEYAEDYAEDLRQKIPKHKIEYLKNLLREIPEETKELADDVRDKVPDDKLQYLKSLLQEIPEDTNDFAQNLRKKIPQDKINYMKHLLQKIPEESMNYAEDLKDKIPDDKLQYIKNLMQEIPEDSRQYAQDLNDKIPEDKMGYAKNIGQNLPKGFFRNSLFDWNSRNTPSNEDFSDKTELEFKKFSPPENLKASTGVKEVIINYDGHTEGVVKFEVSEADNVALDIEYRLSSANTDKLFKKLSFNQKIENDQFIVDISVPRREDLNEAGCISDDRHDFSSLRKYFKRKNQECETILADITIHLPKKLNNLVIKSQTKLNIESSKANRKLKLEQLYIETEGQISLNSVIKVEDTVKLYAGSKISLLRFISLKLSQIKSMRNIFFVESKFEELKAESEYGLIYGSLDVFKHLHLLAANGDINISSLRIGKNARVLIQRLSEENGDLSVALENFMGRFSVDTKFGEVSLLGDNIKVVKNIEKGELTRERIVEGTILKGKLLDQRVEIKSNNGDVVLVLLQGEENL